MLRQILRYNLILLRKFLAIPFKKTKAVQKARQLMGQPLLYYWQNSGSNAGVSK